MDQEFDSKAPVLIAGVRLRREYLFNAPKGVGARNSVDSLIGSLFGWKSSVALETGLEATYRWVYYQLVESRWREGCHS